MGKPHFTQRANREELEIVSARIIAAKYCREKRKSGAESGVDESSKLYDGHTMTHVDTDEGHREERPCTVGEGRARYCENRSSLIGALGASFFWGWKG